MSQYWFQFWHSPSNVWQLKQFSNIVYGFLNSCIPIDGFKKSISRIQYQNSPINIIWISWILTRWTYKFYSRGDIEPYVLLDEEYTTQLYGSTYNPKLLCHYTTEDGVQRIADSILSGQSFDISSFTVMDRPFFRQESNILIKFVGNVRAGFRSDIKSMATDTGHRACNMYRLDYPGKDQNNICYELDSCDGSVKTSLWNEYIATPIQILEIEKTWKYCVNILEVS